MPLQLQLCYSRIQVTNKTHKTHRVKIERDVFFWARDGERLNDVNKEGNTVDPQAFSHLKGLRLQQGEPVCVCVVKTKTFFSSLVVYFSWHH